MRRASIVGVFFLEQCAGAFASVRAATTLLFSDGGEVRRILFVVVIFKEAMGFCLLFCFAEVNAFLLWMMWFFCFAAVASYMRGPLLAFLSAVLTLRDRSALLGD